MSVPRVVPKRKVSPSDDIIILPQPQEIINPVVPNLDAISDGVTYAKVLASVLYGGRHYLGSCIGNLDNIADGTSYAHVLGVYLDAHQVKLDSVKDGSNYKKVAAGDITGGHVDLDAVTDGPTTYAKVKGAYLDTGQVKMDDVKDGSSYVKLGIGQLATVLQAPPASYSNPSGTRVLDTVYQNTSGKMRLITITVYCFNANTGGAAELIVYSSSANPPLTCIGGIGAMNSGAGKVDAKFAITFMVLPNNYYKATTNVDTGCSVGFIYWTEWDLF